MAASGAQYNVWGSPSLAHLIRRTAEDVPHPTIPGKTLWDARNDKGPFDGIGDEEFMASYNAAELKRQSSSTGVQPLGSGSDYTVFLQHLGVSTITVHVLIYYLTSKTNRLQAWIKALPTRPLMLPSTITLFMTQKDGRNNMRIQVLSAM